jgi:hypothetical protein
VIVTGGKTGPDATLLLNTPSLLGNAEYHANLSAANPVVSHLFNYASAGYPEEPLLAHFDVRGVSWSQQVHTCIVYMRNGTRDSVGSIRAFEFEPDEYCPKGYS